MARNIRLNCNVSESSRFARRIRRSPSIARFWALLLPLSLLSFAAKSAHAQTNYYWDPNFSNSIPGSDNNGTWDTISGIWFNPDLGTDTSWVNDPAAIANIGTSGNVSPQVITMGAPITVGTINFLGGTGGSYTIAADATADPLTINSGINLGAGAGPATINAPIVLGAPNLWTNNSSSTFTVGGTVANGGNMLTVGGSGNTTINGPVSGAGGLAKSGAGTLLLTGPTRYAGNTLITSGTLRLAAGATPGLYEGIVANGTNAFDTTDPIPTSGANSNGIQLTTRLANSTTAGQTFPTGIPNTSTVGYTGFINNPTNAPVTYTFAENFDDSLMLTIDGITVLNDPTSNNPTMAEYTLTPGPHSIQLYLGQGTGLVGPANGGLFNGYVGGTFTPGVPLGNLTTGAYTGPTGYDPTIPGGTSDNLGFGYTTVLGSTNPSDYQALTDPGNGSFLYVVAPPVLTGSVILSSNTTFDASTSTLGITVGSLADAAGNPTGAQILLGTNTLTTGTDNTDTIFSGLISGFGGNLTKVGTGTFTLAGQNTYSGGTTVNGGTIVVAPTGALGPAPLTINSPGTVTLQNSTQSLPSLSGNGTLNLNGGTVTNLTITGGPSTFSGLIQGSSGAGLTVSSGGTLTLTNGANSYPGGTIVNGTLNLTGSGTILGTGMVNIGSTGNLSIVGGVQGLAGQFSAGFTAASNFASLSALQSHFASLTGLVTANSTAVGASFNYGTTGNLFPSPFNTGTPTLEGFWQGVINIGTAGQYTFGLDSDDGSMLFIDGATVVSNNVAQGISTGIEASGTLNLSAGFHTIDIGYYNSGGAYGFEAFMNPGNTVANSPDQLLSNSILFTAPPTTTSIASLTGTGTVNLSTAILQIGQVNGVSSNSTFAGSFNGDSFSAINKIGTGTLTLSGNSQSTSVAPINVLNGTLRVTNTTGSVSGGGAVIVGGTTAGGATGSPTLTGNGSIGGPVTIVGSGAGNVAGHLAPSDFTGSVGTTLTLTDGLTLNTGSNLDFNLNSNTTSGNDLVNITGTGAVNYSSVGVLNINAYGGSLATGTYTLINDSAGATPTGGTAWTIGTNNASNAGTSSLFISVIGNNLDLTVAPQLTWGGQTNGSWLNSPTNWFSGSTATTFSTQSVSFGDKQFTGGPAVTVSNITVSSPVSPANVTFSNNTVPYTITSNDAGAQGITGSTAVTLAGSSSVTLVGPNTYTGPTVLDAGTLVIGNGNSIGSASAALTFNGGTLKYAPSSTNTDISGHLVTFTVGGATIDLNGNSMTYANSIGNGGVGGLKINNSGAAATLTLNGANNYAGGTTINSGGVTLISTNSTTLGSGPLTFAASGGTLRLSGSSQTVAGLLNSYYLAGSNNIPTPANDGGNPGTGNGWSLFANQAIVAATFGPLTPSPGIFLASNDNAGAPFTTYYYGGNVGSTNGFIPNTNGNALNTGTNFTLISQGTINITTSGTYTFGTTSDDGSMLFIDVGGTWQTVVNNNYSQGYTQRTGQIALTAGQYPIEIAYYEGGGGYLVSAQGQAGATTLNGTTDLPSALDLQFTTDPSVNMGLSVTTVANQNYSNTVLVNATSNIDLGNVPSASFGPLTIGTNQLNVFASGTSSFARSVTLGAVTLTGNPTFDVASSASTLNLGALNDNGTPRTITFQDTGVTQLTSAATSLVQGTVVNVSGKLVVGASTALGSSAQVNLTGAGTFTLNPLAAVSQTISSLSGPSGTTVNLNAGTLTIGSADNLSSTYAGNLSDISGGTLVQSGAGTLTLTGNGSGLVSGTHVSVNGGGLNSNSSNALGTFAQVSVPQGTTLSLGANNQQFSSLGGAGTVNLNGNSLTIGNTDNVSSVFSGVLANGTGSTLIKNGTGTFTISGANTQTGGATVNAGTLRVGAFPANSANTPLGLANTGLITLNGGTLALQGNVSPTPIQVPGLLMQFYNTAFGNGDLGSLLNAQSTGDLAAMTSHFAAIQSSLALTAPSTTGAGTSPTYLQFPGTGAGTPPQTQSTGNGNSNAGSAFAAQGFASTTNYEALMTGNITITNPGTYTFYTASDDGSVMYVNGGGNGTVGTLGEQTVNNNNNQGVTQRSGTYTFASAGTYPVEIGYYQGGGGAGLTVSYDGPDTGDTTNNPTAATILNIPNSVLSYTTFQLNANQSYGNNFSVTNGSVSGVSVAGSLATTVGDLSINGTLNVTSPDTTTNPYSLTFAGATGITTLTGNANFNVSNSAGGGVGTLVLGALNDGGTARTIGFGGTGAVTLSQAATSLVVGTQVNITGGTLNSNVGGTATSPGSLGSFARVSVAGGATLALGPGASQTISSLSGLGNVNLGSSTLTVGNTDNVIPITPFAGSISDAGSLTPGSIVKTNSGTLYLAGPSTYNGGTTILGGTLAVGATNALGTGPVTLATGKLQFAGLNPSIATGGAIGIHLGTDVSGGQFALAPTSAAGVSSAITGGPSYVMSNWNNAVGQNGNTSNVSSGTNTGILVNSLGAPSGATVSWTSNAGTFGPAQTTPTPDNQLMGSFLNDGSNTGMGNSVTISNIPYASYEVVTYVGSEGGGANGRSSLLTVAASGGPSTVYSFSTDTSPGTNPYPYVPITNTTSGVYPAGNYAVTTGLTGSSVTVSDGSYPNGANTGLEAIEIINTSPGVTTVTLPNSIAVTGPATIDLTGTNIDTAGPLTIGSTVLNVSGGSIGANLPYTLTLGTINLSGNPILNVSNNGFGTGNLILGSLNDGGSPRTITFSGSGTVTLNSGASSMVPGTVINLYAGTLISNSSTAIGSTSTINVLAVANFNLGASQTVSALGGAGIVNLGSNTLTVGSSDNLSSNFGGSLRGGNLRVAGNGKFTLSGANTYTGTTTVTSGTLALAPSGSLSNTAITVNSGATFAPQFASGQTLSIGSGGAGTAGATLNLSGGTLDLTSGGNIGAFAVKEETGFFGSALIFTGGTLKFDVNSSGADELLLSGPTGATASVSGTNVISVAGLGSALTPGAQYTLISLPSGSGGLTGTFVFANGGTTEVLPIGNASYRLSLNNTPTAETLGIGISVSSTWLPTAGGSYNWSNPASNWSGGNVPQVSGDGAVFGATTNNDQIITLDQSLIDVGGLTFNNSGTGTYTINSIGNNTLAFDNGGAGATVLLNNATNNNIISAPVALNSKVTADIAAGTQLTLTGQLAGATALNINPDSGNTGTLIISANNAGFLTAAITLNAGLVNFGAGSLGSGSITFAGTSTLQYASNNTQDISSQLQAIPSGVTAMIDTGGNNVGFGTGLSGGGGLTKAGSGVLTLGGTNTYQSATLISGGGLAVNGSLAAASTVTVNANTTLGGSGTVNGPVIVQSGGHVAPSIGQFFAAGVTSNFGNGLTLNSGSVLDFNLSNVADGPGSAPPNSLNSSNDHIVVNGPLSLNGGTLNLNEYDNSLQVGTYELIGYSGVLNAPNGAAGWSVANQPAGFNFSFSVANPNQFDLVVTTGSGNATWSSNSNNSYNSPGNWTPSNVPSSPGQIAVIGTGTQGTVTINAGVTLGQLDFDDTGNPNSFTAYTLGGSGTLTLDNSGSGAQVKVASNLNPIINTTLNLADAGLSTTFNVGSGASLDVGGSINESAVPGQNISLIGGGTLLLDGTNGYTGSTTVTNGTLRIGLNNPAATLGAGPLAIGGSGIVEVDTSVAAGGLSGAVGSQLNVSASQTLSVNQTGTGTFSGALSLGGSSGLAVNTGTVQLKVSSSTIGFGVTATVASGATLQLAGPVSALSNSDGTNPANVITHGTFSASDGTLSVTGTNQTVGTVTGDSTVNGDGAMVYAGNTTVGDGTNAASLTAMQILQNTLTINANSTVTIAPSAGTEGGAIAAASSTTSIAAPSAAPATGSSSPSDPFTAIQDAIASGSISSTTGQRLENRIAAIERLAATDPGLDVSLVESRVLAALPSSSALSSTESSPLADSDSGLLAADASAIGESSGAGGTFAASASSSGNPAAVPEPSALLLAAIAGLGLAVAVRRRSLCSAR